jgi:AcrR family transcriptional regulator
MTRVPTYQEDSRTGDGQPAEIRPDASRPDPVREQLIEARRNQILDAAASIFASKGFHNTTTKEIATAAGVSEGTIYNYFENKFDLLIGILSRLAQIEQLPAEMADALQSDVRAFFVAAFQHRLGRIVEVEEMLQAILPQVFFQPDLRQQFHRQYVQRIATILEQYVQAQVALGRLHVANVPLTVRALQAMFIGLLVMRILGDDVLCQEWDQVPELLAGLVFDGLSTADES